MKLETGRLIKFCLHAWSLNLEFWLSAEWWWLSQIVWSCQGLGQLWSLRAVQQQSTGRDGGERNARFIAIWKEGKLAVPTTRWMWMPHMSWRSSNEEGCCGGWQAVSSEESQASEESEQPLQLQSSAIPYSFPLICCCCRAIDDNGCDKRTPRYYSPRVQ